VCAVIRRRAALHHGCEPAPAGWLLIVPKLNHKPYASASNLSALRMARLLVVEDDELSRDIASRWLARHGYVNVETAADGESGLEACVAEPPDILILDHSLPGLSGLAIAEYLCVNFKREERPWIVLFTAAADTTIMRLMSTGYFDDLLRKPCVSEDYIAALARAHVGLRERRNIADKHTVLSASSSSSALHM
jgi:two-component system cell cycle response regulator DivK